MIQFSSPSTDFTGVQTTPEQIIGSIVELVSDSAESNMGVNSSSSLWRSKLFSNIAVNIRHEANSTIAPLLHDEKSSQCDILAIQKPRYNTHNKSSFNSSSSDFYLAHRPKLDTRACFHINKRLDLESWEVESNEGDLCSIRLWIEQKQAGGLKHKKRTWIHNEAAGTNQ